MQAAGLGDSNIYNGFVTLQDSASDGGNVTKQQTCELHVLDSSVEVGPRDFLGPANCAYELFFNAPAGPLEHGDRDFPLLCNVPTAAPSAALPTLRTCRCAGHPETSRALPPVGVHPRFAKLTHSPQPI